MSRILFAWELGGGYGHLGRFRQIARLLVERGHSLTLAVRDVERANVVFGALPVGIVQAPICTKTYNGLAEPPLNYAEILMRYGYLDKPLLAGMVRAWRGLLDITGAELIVADHSPTALLASRGRSAARVLFGNPFAVPPPVSPSPNMRPWMPVPRERLADSDGMVLGVINDCLPPAVSPLRNLYELFEDAEIMFTGLPELDPYGPRDAGRYLGLYCEAIGTVLPRWPQGEGKRVFAYLHGEYQHIEATLAALANSGAGCLAHLSGGPSGLRAKYEGHPRLIVSDALIDLSAAVAGSDLCVCHGNSGTVLAVLRAGKPMVLFPNQLETFLLARRVETLGMARVVHPDLQPFDVAGILSGALDDGGLADAAAAYAARHGEPAVGTIAERAAGRIEALAKTRGSSS